uniref:Uncharacterized protein n=1 Tax=Daucus carota subsp. sativus TaxID=79200 RepID=A0A161ZJW7_DAUCS
MATVTPPTTAKKASHGYSINISAPPTMPFTILVVIVKESLYFTHLHHFTHMGALKASWLQSRKAVQHYPSTSTSSHANSGLLLYMYSCFLKVCTLTPSLTPSNLNHLLTKIFSPTRIWLLRQRDDDYYSLRYTDPKEYFAGVRREWAFRREESDHLRNDLIGLSAKLPVRDSLIVYPARNFNGSWGEYHHKVIEAVELIREENHRMLLHRCRFYMLQLAKDSATANGREMTFEEECQLLQNPHYISDDHMSDEESTDDDDPIDKYEFVFI